MLTTIGFPKTKFFPENNSNGVFIKVKINPDYYGLRDRDFLLDSEIIKIQSKYPNYHILKYYCIENYLYHPNNINELKLEGFDIQMYTGEILKQKNNNKYEIISNFKKSRDSYQEFKLPSDKIRDKDESDIIKSLESDDLEIFFKFYSMKDKFNKSLIEKYQLTPTELSGTNWFKERINEIIK